MNSSELARQVEQVLSNDSITRAYAIGVAVEDDTVRLLGEVPSTTVKDLARALAEGVPGVKRISNEIEVWPRDGYG